MKKKVLLVEDNSENRYLATFLLQGKVYTITPCENGASALRALKVDPYDLVLLDLQLPDIDGFEVARHIRKNLNLSMPIIAVSAFAMPGDRQRAKEVGCNAYIEKPIDPDHFVEQITDIMDATAAA